MIVRYNNKLYFVLWILFSLLGKRDYVHCREIDGENSEWLHITDLYIEDGRIPKNTCMYRMVGISDDIVLYLENNAIYEYGNTFYEDLEDDKYEALLIYYTYLNDIRVLHGFPPKDLSFLEKYKPIPSKTAEEKRQDELSAELDEYLRIGEEIEESKKHNPKN